MGKTAERPSDSRYNPCVDPNEHAVELLRAGPVCNHCLGQQFAQIGHGLTGEERGRLVRALARPAVQGAELGTSPCWVCGDVFGHVPKWAERAVELLADHELSTFLFGVRLSPRLEATQEFLAERFPSRWAEPVRRELNRCLGREFERVLAREKRSATVDFTHPDVRFTVDLERGSVDMQVAPLFFSGRYRKLARGIPQTHWPCRECRGRGCSTCEGSGKQYPESVEELVVPHFVEACGGTGGKLHGAGREDVDARMLGRGRPFVVQVVEPRRRTVDLNAITTQIRDSASGKVEVLELTPAAPSTVEKVKAERADKRYRMQVDFDAPVSAGALEQALQLLVGPINQRTPERVRHRRADLVRPRKVHSAAGQLHSPTEAQVEFLCEGGLYVKELVSGDQGSTEPNLSGLLGVKSRVSELDVLEVLDETTGHTST
ncbi:MAG: tRNA pseudouridine(54/55) synthase Pus10 [Candidatus Bipolaricaulota bacterium]